MAKKARVFVTLKRGVLDPQGSAVNRALHAMGYAEVSDVRLGKVVELTLDEKVPEAQERSRLEEMCKKLLANTVIEDYRIEL
jgi:phosphoribosylformylglycinamidine synthase subunit PurS